MTSILAKGKTLFQCFFRWRFDFSLIISCDMMKLKSPITPPVGAFRSLCNDCRLPFSLQNHSVITLLYLSLVGALQYIPALFYDWKIIWNKLKFSVVVSAVIDANNIIYRTFVLLLFCLACIFSYYLSFVLLLLSNIVCI